MKKLNQIKKYVFTFNLNLESSKEGVVKLILIILWSFFGMLKLYFENIDFSP